MPIDLFLAAAADHVTGPANACFREFMNYNNVQLIWNWYASIPVILS